ncbi:2-phospho-L-lactate transferase [Candidatus Bathyarchaeota archaeon RBG_16_48_13]|nr:MAG: 2-phospho-L-lactate transferase [Candidatus Bathyarchaeota archaeon RBG_16_48_13]
MYTVLAGGVGAARFLQGFLNTVDPSEVTIIVNTGDDEEFYGLHVSPDLDIVMYTLAGIVDQKKGWGIYRDTFLCMEVLHRYGEETWFKLGDMDLATHVLRTELLDENVTLSEVTRKLCHELGIRSRIIPMSNNKVSTMVRIGSGFIKFQEYFVKRATSDDVNKVIFKGIANAKPAPDVVDSIMDSKGIIVAPSNPIVSIGTILGVRGVRKALRDTKARKVAISPIVGGNAIKGPADRLMRGLGMEPSAYGVAALYRDFLDWMVIDEIDVALKGRIEGLGMNVGITDTIMRNQRKKENLARFILDIFGRG